MGNPLWGATPTKGTQTMVRKIIQAIEQFLLGPVNNPLPKEVKDKLRDEGKGVPFK